MKSIGTIIRETRESANITLQELGDGLCTFQTLSRMERDERDVDKFLFDVLVERLGRNPDRLECVLSKQQYERIAYYDEAEEGIVEGNSNKALRGMRNFRKRRDEEGLLDDMLYYRMKGFYWLERKRKPRRALGYFEQALRIIMPNLTLQPGNLYSTWELETFMGYAKTRFALGEKEEAIVGLFACYEFAKKWEDAELRARIQPKCAYYIALWKAGSLEQRISLCEEAVELLRRSSVSYLLEPLLAELSILYQETANRDGLNRVRYFREPLAEEIKEYAPKRLQDAMVFRWKQCDYHIDYELIRGERIRQGMTQEDLAEDIYKSPISISNIECGKAAPNRRGFGKIMEKLGVNRGRIATFVAVNSFTELERLWEIRKEVGLGNHQKALQLLESSDFDAKEQVMLYRFLIDFKEGKTDGETYIKEIEDMLKETYSLGGKKFCRTPFQWEMDAIITWGGMMEDKNVTRVLEVLRNINREYSKSERDEKHCYRIYSELLAREITCLAMEHEGKQLKRFVQQAERYEFVCGKGGGLSGICCGRIRQMNRNLDQITKDAYKGMVFAELFYDRSVEEKQAYYVYYERRQHSAEV
ncbi:MAG: helix-turn-helix transcriptional regulator [Lachnospiraceae bacterium]|nr:helix-turn-helix transcriptional regulator [Lachnospiraceae bacterium]